MAVAEFVRQSLVFRLGVLAHAEDGETLGAIERMLSRMGLGVNDQEPPS